MWPFKKSNEAPDYTEFLEELHLLCKEWFHNQIHDLPEDELPPQEEIDQDIIDMRDDTFQKVLPIIESSNSVRDGLPNDSLNSKVILELVEKYQGHEQNTPIFTKLALSKVNDSRYKIGWPLCVIRTIAETYFEQSTSA